MGAIDWTATGTIATAIGVLIAIAAIGITVYSDRKRALATRAAELRESIRSFTVTTLELIRTLQDGTGIIAAANQTVEVIRSSLNQNASQDDLWEFLGDDGLALSAATTGWSTSPVTSELRKYVADVSSAGERLSGELNLLSSSGALVRKIAEDGYSPLMFRSLLTSPLLDMFKSEVGQLPLDRTLWKLALHLHGNTAGYFVARYEEALRSIDEFTKVASSALGALEARDLVAVAQTKSAVGGEETFTGDMRNDLKGIGGLLPTAVIEALAVLIDNIEQQVGKDAARDRLETLPTQT